MTTITLGACQLRFDAENPLTCLVHDASVLTGAALSDPSTASLPTCVSLRRTLAAEAAREAGLDQEPAEIAP